MNEHLNDDIADADMVVVILARELRKLGGSEYQEFVEFTAELLRLARLNAPLCNGN